MRIGDLALATGVNAQTIRFYERRGLLPSPAREGNGYRRYDEGVRNGIAYKTVSRSASGRAR